MKSALPTKVWLTIFAVCISITTACSYTSVNSRNNIEGKSSTGYVITNTNVLSKEGDKFIEGQSILIRNGEIIAIEPLASMVTEGAILIDGTGKFITPALIDSHVHLQKSKNDLKVYLAHGITYVREMSGNKEHLAWSKSINRGEVGPSIEVSSEKIASKSGLWGFINELFWNRINVATQEDAKQLIERLKNEGYANAKIASDISREMYFAVTNEAKQQGLSVVGHIPDQITFDDFIASHHKEIAHIEELVKLLNAEFGYYRTNTAEEFLDYVKERSTEMAKSLKDNGIAVNTSLWYMQSIPEQISNLPSLIQETDLSFTNPAVADNWLPTKNEFELNQSQNYEWWLTFVKANEFVLRALIQNDVVILAGTDAMTSMVIPGASLHKELSSLVHSGLTPSQALKSATSAPGTWMQKDVGIISEGFAADLLILEDNPLENIANTESIHGVFKAGQYYSATTLESMLDSIRKEYE